MSFVVHCKRSEFDVYVGRPSAFGNPFKASIYEREEAVQRFSAWVMTQPALLEKIRVELRGKILGCWCWPKTPCHAEVLARIANDDGDVIVVTEDESLRAWREELLRG